MRLNMKGDYCLTKAHELEIRTDLVNSSHKSFPAGLEMVYIARQHKRYSVLGRLEECGIQDDLFLHFLLEC